MTLAVVDNGLTPAERQAAARDAYRASVEAGHPLTGADLGRQFGRTGRWGRTQISKARAEVAASTNGNEQRISRDIGPEPRDAFNPSDLGTHRPPGQCTDARNGHHDATTAAISPPRPPAEPPGDGPDGTWLDSAITLAVALVAAAASYGHMLDVALVAGEPLWIARAFPITVDGLVLAALRRGPNGRHWLALAAAVSIAANILAQYPDHAAAAGPIVSAWPPLALYGTHRLLHNRRGVDRPSR